MWMKVTNDLYKWPHFPSSVMTALTLQAKTHSQGNACALTTFPRMFVIYLDSLYCLHLAESQKPRRGFPRCPRRGTLSWPSCAVLVNVSTASTEYWVLELEPFSYAHTASIFKWTFRLAMFCQACQVANSQQPTANRLQPAENTKKKEKNKTKLPWQKKKKK